MEQSRFGVEFPGRLGVLGLLTSASLTWALTKTAPRIWDNQKSGRIQIFRKFASHANGNWIMKRTRLVFLLLFLAFWPEESSGLRHRHRRVSGPETFLSSSYDNSIHFNHWKLLVQKQNSKFFLLALPVKLLIFDWKSTPTPCHRWSICAFNFSKRARKLERLLTGASHKSCKEFLLGSGRFGGKNVS